MKISFANPAAPTKGTAVVLCSEGGKWSKTAATLDAKLKGALKRAAKASGFEG